MSAESCNDVYVLFCYNKRILCIKRTYSFVAYCWVLLLPQSFYLRQSGKLRVNQAWNPRRP